MSSFADRINIHNYSLRFLSAHSIYHIPIFISAHSTYHILAFPSARGTYRIPMFLRAHGTYRIPTFLSARGANPFSTFLSAHGTHGIPTFLSTNGNGSLTVFLNMNDGLIHLRCLDASSHISCLKVFYNLLVWLSYSRFVYSSIDSFARGCIVDCSVSFSFVL